MVSVCVITNGFPWLKSSSYLFWAYESFHIWTGVFYKTTPMRTKLAVPLIKFSLLFMLISHSTEVDRSCQFCLKSITVLSVISLQKGIVRLGTAYYISYYFLSANSTTNVFSRKTATGLDIPIIEEVMIQTNKMNYISDSSLTITHNCKFNGHISLWVS